MIEIQAQNRGQIKMKDFKISVEGADVTKTYLTTLLIPVKIVSPNLGPPSFKYSLKPL
jgi:hypothetical protein